MRGNSMMLLSGVPTDSPVKLAARIGNSDREPPGSGDDVSVCNVSGGDSAGMETVP